MLTHFHLVKPDANHQRDVVVAPGELASPLLAASAAAASAALRQLLVLLQPIYSCTHLFATRLGRISQWHALSA
jgi:hypothetical protein